MAEGSYEQGARVGLGIKMAHEAVLAFIASGGITTYDQYVEGLESLVDRTVTAVVDTQARHLVADAFPGAQVQAVPPQPAQVDRTPEQQAPAPPQPAPAPAGPAPFPNQSQGGGDWRARKAEDGFRLFFQDTTAWNDNRFKKSSGEHKPTAPDFSHKTQKDGDFKVGIWLKDAPEWALPQLRQMGLVA